MASMFLAGDLIISDPQFSRWFAHAYAGVDDEE